MQQAKTEFEFTAAEVAIMRRQYDRKVPPAMIIAQWGMEYKSPHGALFRLFRRHDPSFETRLTKKSKTPKWCPWCGEDMPPFSDRKFCDDPACVEERDAERRAGTLAKLTCACGNKKAYGRVKCQSCDTKLRQASKAQKIACACGGVKSPKAKRCKACETKERKKKKLLKLRMIKSMAEEGYSNAHIAVKAGVALKTVWFTRSKLNLHTQRTAWRPEQLAYWRAKFIEAGTTKGLWQKAGMTRSAFRHRLRRIEKKEEAHGKASAGKAATDKAAA